MVARFRGFSRKHTILSFFALMVFSIFAGCASNTPPPPHQPARVFLIIIDALRADHLGCYGYERNTSPVLDSLASSGILFSLCQAQASWTLPSVANIWTGRTVRSHRTAIRDGISYGVDQSLPTISTVLNDNGYTTLGIVNNGLLSSDFGFHNGFDNYSLHDPYVDRGSETITEALEWLRENEESSDPLFMAIHLFDVHAPYDPPPPYDTLFCDGSYPDKIDWVLSEENGEVMNPEDRDILVARYDGSIRYADDQIGRLLAGVRELNMAENSLVIITADHGEEFLDHGYVKHGPTLYQEVLHVPLIISGFNVSPGLNGYLSNNIVLSVTAGARWSGWY